jgi:glutathione S-transferase
MTSNPNHSNNNEPIISKNPIPITPSPSPPPLPPSTNISTPLHLIEFFPTPSIYAYAALAGSPLSHLIIENAIFPTMVTGDLPQLRVGTKIIPSTEILSYLAQYVTDLDAGLSNPIRAQINAFSSLIWYDLKLAIDIARFSDDEHFSQVTRKRMMKRIPFPMNRFEIWKFRREMIQRIQSILGVHITSSSHESMKWARETVSKVLNIFNKRLGDEKWILGTRGPTSLDCLLFGALADVQDEPLFGISTSLASEFPLLEAFYRRIAQKIHKSHYFTVGDPLELSILPSLLVLKSSPPPSVVVVVTTVHHHPSPPPPSSFSRATSNSTTDDQNKSQPLPILAYESRQFLAFGVITTIAYLILTRNN